MQTKVLDLSFIPSWMGPFVSPLPSYSVEAIPESVFLEDRDQSLINKSTKGNIEQS